MTAANLSTIDHAQRATALALLAAVRYSLHFQLRADAPGVAALHRDLDTLAEVTRERGPLAALESFSPAFRR